jgi:hypothetical protein
MGELLTICCRCDRILLTGRRIFHECGGR